MSNDHSIMQLDQDTIMIARLAFLYGYYSAKEFQKIVSCSNSKYGRAKLYLQYVFGDELEEVKNGKKAILRFRHDKFEPSENTLLQLFNYPKFDVVKALYFLKTLQTISSSEGVQLSLNDLKLSTKYDDRTYTRWVKELESWGYLSKASEGRAYVYSIARQPMDVLNDEELLALCNLTDLARCIYPPGIFANYLLDTLKLRYEQGELRYESPFMKKHRHMLQVLDDDKLWKLLAAIDEEKILCITMKKEYRYFQPVRIIINETDGRRYVWGKSLKYDTVRIFRLDRIADIREEHDLTGVTKLSPEQAEDAYRAAKATSLTGTTKPGKELVTGTLTYQKTLHRVIRRMFPDAKPTSLDKNTEQIHFTINTGKELKPFLRQYLGKVRLTDCSDDTLTGELNQEMQKWRALYGIV